MLDRRTSLLRNRNSANFPANPYPGFFFHCRDRHLNLTAHKVLRKQQNGAPSDAPSLL